MSSRLLRLCYPLGFFFGSALYSSFTYTSLGVTAGKILSDCKLAKLPGFYTRFMGRVQLLPENVRGEVKDQPIFKYESNNWHTGVQLLSLEQRRSWVFDIFRGPGHDHRLELFSFQMAGDPKLVSFPKHEQRWGVKLSCRLLPLR